MKERWNHFNKLKLKRKKVTFAACSAVFLAMGLAGCRGTEQPANSQSVESLGNVEEPAGEAAEQIESASFVSGSAGTMVETEKNLYFKFNNAIWRLGKENNKLKQLRAFEEEESNQTFWVAGTSLYFDLSRSGDQLAGKSAGLNRIDFATGKEERLADLMVTPSNLYVSGGYLYAQGYQTRESYKLAEDGSLSRDDSEAGTIYEKIPEGMEELYTVSLAYAVDHWGYMPLWDGQSLVIADKDGSNPRKLSAEQKRFGQIFGEDGIYTVSQEPDSRYICKRYDVKTLEEKVVFEADTFPTLLQYRDETLYFMENGSYGLIGMDSSFYAVDAQGGEPRLLTTIAMEPGTLTENFYGYYGNFYVTEDAVYSQKIQDYGVYIVKKDLEGKEIFLSDQALYQSLIRELGHVEAQEKALKCADGEKTAAEYYVERLVFDGDSDAVQMMNQTLEAEEERQIQAGENMAAIFDEAWIHDEEFKESTFTYVAAGVTYLDDRYCSIQYDGYEYTGGAHGMPFRSYFLFDRQTGKQLNLADVLETPEEELKTIVSRHFREKAEKTNFAFQSPEDLEAQVAEDITLESPFFITPEGVSFFYSPYAIAAYSEGFPTVTVPYEELKMKIELKAGRAE